ncbi:MAG: hypothetical protein ABSG36_08370 [Acidimicrobiales bacterium]|jgi:hypothetical protein
MGEKGTKGWAMIQHDGWRSLQDRGWVGDMDKELHNPQTGQTASFDVEKGQWVDSAGGQPLTSDPNAVA